jgi:hypothetical protein
MSAESIARALGGHKIGHRWMARCPAYDDYDPSPRTEKALRTWGATAPSRQGKLRGTRFKLRTGAALRLLSACFSSRRKILSKNANLSVAVTLSFWPSSRIRESRVARNTTDARLSKSLTGPQVG